jgi:hypothetical protein
VWVYWEGDCVSRENEQPVFKPIPMSNFKHEPKRNTISWGWYRLLKLNISYQSPHFCLGSDIKNISKPYPSIIEGKLYPLAKSFNRWFQEDSRILHELKIGCQAFAPFIPYSISWPDQSPWSFVFEVSYIMSVALRIEEDIKAVATQQISNIQSGNVLLTASGDRNTRFAPCS